MNAEERRLLTDFLDQLTQAKGVTRDPDADRLISEAVARQPDAAYLLVQKALLQQQALNSASARIEDLQNRLQRTRPASGGGFLGNDPWAGSSRPAAGPAASGWSGGPAAASGFGGMGSFLGTAAATAAGIAGGAFLFQGIENLLGHHGGGGFMGSSGFDGDHVDNVTINEYYGSDAYPDDRGGDDGFQNADFDPTDDGYEDLGDDDSIDV